MNRFNFRIILPIRCAVLALVLFLAPSLAYSNTDSREWTFLNGEKLFAELGRYDEKTKMVTLLINNKETKVIPYDAFSIVD